MGVSFAIPINIVKNVAEQLKENGSVLRGWLGVEMYPPFNDDVDLAKSLGLERPEGALLDKTSNPLSSCANAPSPSDFFSFSDNFGQYESMLFLKNKTTRSRLSLSSFMHTSDHFSREMPPVTKMSFCMV